MLKKSFKWDPNGMRQTLKNSPKVKIRFPHQYIIIQKREREKERTESDENKVACRVRKVTKNRVEIERDESPNLKFRIPPAQNSKVRGTCVARLAVYELTESICRKNYIALPRASAIKQNGPLARGQDTPPMIYVALIIRINDCPASSAGGGQRSRRTR